MEIKTFYISPKIVNIKLLDIDIKNPARNNERCSEDIVTLAASIKKSGLINPLFVRRSIENPKKYILVSGHRRLQALLFLGAKYAPAVVLSLTDAEAELIFLCDEQTKKPLTLFERALYIARILNGGRVTKAELADCVGITQSTLERQLKILNIKNEQREVIINHKFDEEFIYLFLEFDEQKRQEILNHIIVKSMGNDEAKKYLNELKNPVEKPQKYAIINNDTLILNSIERIISQLEYSGIEAICRKREFEEKREYVIEVKK